MTIANNSTTTPRVTTRDLGPIGTGSNMFRSGVVHSSGAVFIGTYGPAPAIIWKYDPKTSQLTKVAAPGEYQLDCMVEAPNRKIYIGTAYGGVVYELDPETLEVKDLGAPPVDSTSWIFTMTVTRDGEIFGARGVGLFHLDWRTGKMEAIGVVPGGHGTRGVSSEPISRNLHQRSDGLIWGDTNRWIFTLDPRSGRIAPIVDVASYDEACYGIMHSSMPEPFDDLYFSVYMRFGSGTPRNQLLVCRAEDGKLEPVEVPGLTGQCFAQGWYSGHDGKAAPRWIIVEYSHETQRSSVALVDVQRRRVDERWELATNDTPPARAWSPDASGLWFYTNSPGGLFRADPAARRLRRVATNPMPVESRCLAAAPDGRLGVDTYDSGFVFTFDPKTGRSSDHGKVYFDDHRCNYGPAVFAGRDSEYFVANHGENERIASLWVTELNTNRHWRIGDAVVQLVRLNDGGVCGTFGPNPPSLDFNPERCWTPAWSAAPSNAFRYVPPAQNVQPLTEWGKVGPLAPLPGTDDQIVAGVGASLRIYSISRNEMRSELAVEAPVIALAADPARNFVYAVLQGNRMARFDVRGGLLTDEQRFAFGAVERGCFVLPRSGRLVGIALMGTLTVLAPDASEPLNIPGPMPLHAGPAVHPTVDAWYFAHHALMEYSLD